MHPSVFKVLLCHSLLTMNCLCYSKCVLILKGGTYSSAVLVAIGKGVYLFIPCTILCGPLQGVTITGMKVM